MLMVKVVRVRVRELEENPRTADSGWEATRGYRLTLTGFKGAEAHLRTNVVLAVSRRDITPTWTASVSAKPPRKRARCDSSTGNLSRVNAGRDKLRDPRGGGSKVRQRAPVKQTRRTAVDSQRKQRQRRCNDSAERRAKGHRGRNRAREPYKAT